MGGGKQDGRGGREGEGDEERGHRERDGRGRWDAVTRRRDENRDVGTARRWGRIRRRGLGPGSRGAEEAGRALGGPRRGARVGAGAPRTEGRGLGLPRGGRGRGGERRGGGAGPRRRRSHPPRGGCAGGGAPAVAAAAGPTDRRPGPRGPTAGCPELIVGRETAAADDARPQAQCGWALPRGLTAAGRRPQHRAREPAPRGGQCPRPPGPSGRARPTPPGSPGQRRRRWSRGLCSEPETMGEGGAWASGRGRA